MPGVIDHETMYVDQLPTIWSPIEGTLAPEEHVKALEDQATANLLWASPVPEQILRLLLNETAIDRLLEPPAGFDPEVQGDWQNDRLTFGFRRPIELLKEERNPDGLVLEYKLEGAGYWMLSIAPDEVTLGRI